MAVLTTGNTFSNGNQVTASSLNNAVNDAEFAAGAVDNTSTQLSSGAIIVKDLGISTGKIAIDAVGTDQLANDVVISTSGSITGAAGSFTTLAASGDVTFDTTTLKVDSTNNRVGIGTASPSYKLDVNSGATNQVALFESTDATAYIELADNTGSAQLLTPSSGDFSIYTGGSGAGNLGVSRLTVKANGDVGIGDDTPSYKLDVNGTGRFTSTVQFDGQTQNYDGAYDIYRSGAGYLRHRIADQTLSIGVTNTDGIVHYPIVMAAADDDLIFNNEDGEMARFDTSGNLGIGTSSPANALHVVGNDEETSAINTATATSLEVAGSGTSPNSGGTILFSANSGSWKFAAIKSLVQSGGNNTFGDLAFSVRPSSTDSTLTEAMRIKYNGNVGIGTEIPSYKLEVNGDTVIGDDTTGNARINSISGDSAYGSGNVHYTFKGNEGTGMRRVAANTLAFDTTSQERVRIDSVGNVGIGTESPSAPLEVTSTTGGVILPRMTTTQKNAISSPSNGEMVYDTTDNKFYGYANGAWVALH